MKKECCFSPPTERSQKSEVISKKVDNTSPDFSNYLGWCTWDSFYTRWDSFYTRWDEEGGTIRKIGPSCGWWISRVPAFFVQRRSL